MALPQKLSLVDTQTRWATDLNPIIDNAANNSLLLKNIKLSVGVNNINHKLGRQLQGWIPVRVRAASVVYDQQDSNSTPDKTLVLVASAPVTIDIEVY